MTIFSKLHRHLDPVDSLGEMIFGLIMVLTFTLGASLLSPGEPIDGGEILIAAIGCNLAWGIIDAFLYVLGCLYERRRLANLIAQVRSSADDSKSLAAIRSEMENELSQLADPSARENLYSSIVAAARAGAMEDLGLTRDDVRAAAVVFLIVLSTAIPAALPFLAIDDGYTALRASNLLLIAALFVVGHQWGKHVGVRPLQAGLLIMGIGVVLVLIAIPLGG
jgi:VIT1/CCC1 family predicted Fe2+/Mn2+ transporter